MNHRILFTKFIYIQHLCVRPFCWIFFVYTSFSFFSVNFILYFKTVQFNLKLLCVVLQLISEQLASTKCKFKLKLSNNFKYRPPRILLKKCIYFSVIKIHTTLKRIVLSQIMTSHDGIFFFLKLLFQSCQLSEMDFLQQKKKQKQWIFCIWIEDEIKKKVIHILLCWNWEFPNFLIP